MIRIKLFFVALLVLMCGVCEASQKAASIEFLLSQVRTSTTSLAGGKVYAYEVGSTTLKTIWVDRDKATVANNPYTLDSNGTAQLYADGLYRIVIKDSAGVTKYDRDGLSFYDVASSNAEISISEFNSILDASTNARAAGKTVIIDSPQVVSTAITWPADRFIKFNFGGKITYSGSGAITFTPGSIGDLPIEAFGAVISDTDNTYATANQTAFQNAINAMMGTSFNNGRIILGRGIYRTAGKVIIPAGSRGLTIVGAGPRSSVIKNMNTSGEDAIQIAPATVGSETSAYSITMRDFTIYGNGAGTDGKGLNVKNTYNSHFENLFTQNTGLDGFYFENSYQNTFLSLHARRAGYNYAGGVPGTTATIAGIHMVGNVGHKLDNCVTDENPYGVIGDSGGFEFNKLDTESNGLGGVYIKGASNIKAFDCYSEGTINRWYIGDGTNAIGDATFIGNDFGGSGLTFAKTLYYLIDGNSFRYPYNSILLDGLSNGYMGTNYYSYVNTSPYYAYSEHRPSAHFSGNLIRNGSFENATADGVWPGWTISVPSGDWAGTYTSSSTVSNYAAGLSSAKIVTTAYTTGAGLRLIPSSANYNFVSGRTYTLSFTYSSNVDGALQLTWQTGSVFHANNVEFPSTGGVFKTINFQITAQGANSGLIFYIKKVDTVYLDDVMLYAGVQGQTYTSDIRPTSELEFYRLVATAATTNSLKGATQDWSAISTWAAQPDTPRTVRTVASATAAAGTIQLTGIDGMGKLVTESLTVTPNTTVEGSIPFAVLLTATGYNAGAGQTVSLGQGNSIGLPKTLAGLVKATQQGVDITLPTYSTTYNTVTLPAFTAADVFNFWYAR